MSNVKICVSIAARSAIEFVASAIRSAETADAIELRFDSLEPAQVEPALGALTRARREIDAIVIGTYRSSDNGQGGNRKIPLDDRNRFWKRTDVRSLVDWADVEFDIDPACLTGDGGSAFDRIIRSHHEFDRPIGRAELKALAEKALALDTNGRTVFKVAAMSSDIADAIPLFDALEPDGTILPIGMGEFGVWIRILGAARGSVFTYAAPDEGSGTAPGQPTVSDLLSVYRVADLDDATEVFGIVGRSSVNSLSPYIHNPAFAAAGLNAVYIPLPTIDARNFYAKMISPASREIDLNIRGLSVTHPHKELFAELVDELDETASEIGAVNTVKIADGKVIGCNTDERGFIAPLVARLGDLNGARVGILGSGGAAKAAAYALQKARAEVTLFTRNVSAVKHSPATEGVRVESISGDQDAFAGLDVLVNATPQGSKGELENECPVSPAAFEHLRVAYDMVYNPEETRFLREARKAGIPRIGGLEMLIEQAVGQFEIWTGLRPSRETMTNSAKRRISARS